MTDIDSIRQQYPQYSDMSDGDLADALHQKYYSDMPQDQFYNKIGLSQQPSPMQNEAGVVGKWATGQITAPSAALQTMGNEAQAGWDAAGNLIKAIPGYGYAKEGANAAWQGVQKGAQGVANMIDSPETEQEAVRNGNAISGIASGVSQIAKDHPELAGDVSALGKILPIESTFGLAGDAAKSVLNAAAENSAKTVGKQADANAQYLAAKARNINYVEGLNANAENLKQTYGDIYDKASEISQGIVRNEPNIQKNVTTLLDNLKEDPAHQGMQGTSQAYRDLTAVRDSFDEDGNIPLDSITLLQRRVNDLYSPDMAGDRKAIYNTLNTQLKAATKRAAEENPEWGALQGSGNKLFANFKDTYVDDNATNRIWSLADKSEYENAAATNADPYGAGMDTATKQKLYNLPANVKNMAQYEAMLRKLPPEMADQFTQDVIAAAQQDKSSSLAARISTAYKASRGNLDSIKNLYRMVANKAATEINPAVAESAPHVNDAINYYGNLSDQAYDYFKQRTGRATVSDINYSQPRISYTPAINSAGENVPAFRSADVARKMNPVAEAGASDTGVTPGTQNAAIQADVRASQAYHQGENAAGVSLPPANTPMLPIPKSQRMAVWGNVAQGAAKQLPSATDSTAGDVLRNLSGEKLTINNFSPGTPELAARQRASQAAEELQQQRDEEQQLMQMQGPHGYKRGGAVSEAMIHAGNYKKDHIRFQGLNISIEILKGEIRSGKDKGGKEWSVKIPESYGYILGTVGADGEHVDCYVGPNKKSNRVYIIDQHHHDTKKFDEHKIMLGFPTRDEAVSVYKAGFSDGKGAQRIGKVMRMSMSEFKDWLKNGNTKRPIKSAA